MPELELQRSSTEHWVSAPGVPTWLPISSATALSGASRSTGTVVSSSRKPRATALAASAAMQQRVVDAVGDVRLDRRRPADAHLLHRHAASRRA